MEVAESKEKTRKIKKAHHEWPKLVTRSTQN